MAWSLYGYRCRGSSRGPQYLGCGVRQIRAQTKVRESFMFQVDEECGVWVMSKVDLAAETSSKVMYVKCQKCDVTVGDGVMSFSVKQVNEGEVPTWNQLISG